MSQRERAGLLHRHEKPAGAEGRRCENFQTAVRGTDPQRVYYDRNRLKRGYQMTCFK